MTLTPTPALRRIARAYLEFCDTRPVGWMDDTPKWWPTLTGWWQTCPKCDGDGRYWAFGVGDGTAVCDRCADEHGRPKCRIPILPLHIPAALAIARIRLAEVVPDADAHLDDEIGPSLLAHDPEMTGASDAR